MLWILGLQTPFAQKYQLDQYDVKHYLLDLEISSLHTRISGNVTMNAIVTATKMDTAAIELIDSISSTTHMVVDSVWFNGSPASFDHSGWIIKVPLKDSVSQGVLFSLRVFYHGNGSGCSQSNSNGLFRLNYLGISHTFNTSQPFYSKFWWPCKEWMTDKADSVTFIITTDSANRSASNGLLKSTIYPGNGKVRYRWETQYPISPYLVFFEVGSLTVHIDYAPQVHGADSLLLYNLLIPSSPRYPMHLRAIEKTKQLLVLYSQLLGEYPFGNEKYGYSIVGLPAIGMENQTMCAMGYESLDTTATLYYHSNTWFMTAHELAHQWFGDAVICSTWNDAWLVDGFASYLEYVALQNIENQVSADTWMSGAQATVKSEPGGSVWIPDSLISDVRNIFDYRLIYKKGAAILHILRHEINNDSLFFAILKQFIYTYRYGAASAADFRQIAESVAGIDLGNFFAQWYYGSGFPVFNIHWTLKNDTLVIRTEQTASTTITPGFNVHCDIRIYFPGGDTTIRLFQSETCVEHFIPFAGSVDSIVFDPDRWLIQQHTISTGIKTENDPLLWRVHPNPTTGKLSLTVEHALPFQSLRALIYDMKGRLLQQLDIYHPNTEIDFGKRPSGIYLIELKGLPRPVISRIIRN